MIFAEPLGDGMGVPTVTMARIFKAQQRKLTGNDALLSWESFPHAAMLRVQYHQQKSEILQNIPGLRIGVEGSGIVVNGKVIETVCKVQKEFHPKH